MTVDIGIIGAMQSEVEGLISKLTSVESERISGMDFYTGELYGQSMTVEFLKRLRDEMRFPNLDALKAAIANDVEETVRYFSEK